jgi:peptidoglycan/LPS O-acetylase OafA/YrhL
LAVKDGTQNKAFQELEILRFLLAFAVVCWHYQHFFLVTDVSGPMIAGWDKEQQPFYWPLWLPYNCGSYAVPTFWLISGFIFFWKYAEPISDGRIGWWRFFMLRFSRLYPLHLFTLLLVAALQSVFYSRHHYYTVYPGHDLYRFAINLFMASGWGPGLDIFSFNAPIWSVSAEELVYAAFFVAATKFRQRFWRSLLIAYACEYLMHKLQNHGFSNYMFPLMCAKYYFIGGAIFRVYVWCELKPMRSLRKLGAIPEALGNLTYSSYLMHFPVMIIFQMATDAEGWTRDCYYDWKLWLAYFAAVFGSSYLVFRFLEKPSMGYLRQLRLFSKAQPAT